MKTPHHHDDSSQNTPAGQTESPVTVVASRAVEAAEDALAWTNTRIFFVLAIGTIIVSAIWNAPAEATYISARLGEVFFVMVMAMAFTYLLRPAVNFTHRRLLRSRPGSRVWATALVFLLCGLSVYFFFVVTLRPVTHDVKALWNWFVAQDEVQRRELVVRWQETLDAAIAPYRGYLPQGFADQVRLDRIVPDAITKYGPQLKEWATHVFTHAGFLVELLLLPVLVFYFLCDGPAIRRETALLLPAEWRPRARRMASHLDRVFDGYIRGQVWMCLIAFAVVTVALLLLRVPHALTLGLIAGLTRAIPVVGPLLGGIPLVLICLITTHSIPVTMTLLGGFILLHFIESKVLLPKIIGHEVDLHPVSVIVVLLMGLEFFGFLGVFLAVPVAAVLKIVLAEWHDKRKKEKPKSAKPNSLRLLSPLRLRLRPSPRTRAPKETGQNRSGRGGSGSPVSRENSIRRVQ